MPTANITHPSILDARLRRVGISARTDLAVAAADKPPLFFFPAQSLMIYAANTQ